MTGWTRDPGGVVTHGLPGGSLDRPAGGPAAPATFEVPGADRAQGHTILDFVALIVLAAVAKAEQDIARKQECGNILWTENKAL